MLRPSGALSAFRLGLYAGVRPAGQLNLKLATAADRPASAGGRAKPDQCWHPALPWAAGPALGPLAHTRARHSPVIPCRAPMAAKKEQEELLYDEEDPPTVWSTVVRRVACRGGCCRRRPAHLRPCSGAHQDPQRRLGVPDSQVPQRRGLQRAGLRALLPADAHPQGDR